MSKEAGEGWAVTVYGASQLRGDIWETFYLPDFDPLGKTHLLYLHSLH